MDQQHAATPAPSVRPPSRVPSVRRVLPVQVLDLLQAEAGELAVDIPLLPTLVVGEHPEEEGDGEDEDGGGGGEVEAVADVVVGPVERQERPGRDEAADVAEHDVGADGGRAGGVGDDVGGDLGVAEGAEGEGAAGDEERRAVPDLRVRADEEHDVADHHEGGADDEEDVAAVEPPAEEREEDGEEGADDVRGHGVELLGDDGGLGVDRPDDGGGEEGEALDGDVVEEEDEGGGEGDGAEDAAEDLDGVELVQHLGGGDTLRLDPGDGEILLRLGEPLGGLGPVGQGDERDEGEDAGDDALDGEDHPPPVKAAEVGELQDAGGQETAERAGERGHDDVEGQSEGQLAPPVPPGQVVRDARQHAGLEDAEQEADAGSAVDVGDESGADGADAEPERDGGDEPAGADPLAGHVGGDLEDDVGDVEDGEDLVVVVARHVKVLLEPGELGVACKRDTVRPSPSPATEDDTYRCWHGR